MILTLGLVLAFAVAAGAATLARSALNRAWNRPGSLPVGTLAANLVGSFGAGLVVGSVALGSGAGNSGTPDAAALGPMGTVLVIGGFGAFTTMSTLAGELVTLVDQRRWGLAAGYASGTLIGGTALAMVGMAISPWS
jgi:CrcB protein